MATTKTDPDQERRLLKQELLEARERWAQAAPKEGLEPSPYATAGYPGYGSETVQ